MEAVSFYSCHIVAWLKTARSYDVYVLYMRFRLSSRTT